jgi:cell cycle checkpoint protein
LFAPNLPEELARQTAFCVIDGNGFRFTVEKSGCLQAHVYLKRELFTQFETTEAQQFGINLTILLDCLNIFSSSTSFVSLQISYAGEGRPLLLDMVDGGGRFLTILFCDCSQFF